MPKTAWLTLRTTHGDERRFILRSEVTVLGRLATCDVRIPLASVAPRHCEITAADGGWHLAIRPDEGAVRTAATAEVMLNDEPLTAGIFHPLEDGDRVRVGPITFDFRTGPAEVDIETLVPRAPARRPTNH